MSCGDIFLGLIAVLFPPVAVWIKSGLCTADSLINILLCCLGYVPGLLHAWYIIAKNPEYDYEVIPDSEGGGANSQSNSNSRSGAGGQRVTYYYVSHENRSRGAGSEGYGTQGAAAPVVPQNNRPVAGSSSNGGEGSAALPPPSYADAVKGDNKVQSQE